MKIYQGSRHCIADGMTTEHKINLLSRSCDMNKRAQGTTITILSVGLHFSTHHEVETVPLIKDTFTDTFTDTFIDTFIDTLIHWYLYCWVDNG